MGSLQVGRIREPKVMKKPLKVCINGDGRPVQPPSWVLCKECMAILDAKLKDIGKDSGMVIL